MSKVICIMGESGSGKTTSLRNLDPKETMYIDCDKKGLNYKGWRKDYNIENKNYLKASNMPRINAVLERLENDLTEFKYVVIDTINAIMIGEEMRRMNEKGYDKWRDIAHDIWNLVEDAYSYRDDLTFIIIAHSQTELDDTGYMFTRIKTSGRKLNKIDLEGKFNTVLHAKKIAGQYTFDVRGDNSTCRTPRGAFEEDTIPNDIVPVIEVLSEY